MSFIAKDNGGGDFEPVPEGTHLGICYMLVDVGEQESHFGVKPQVIIGWELPEQAMDDGRPMSISAIYTNSLSSKANLRADLEGWRGRAFTDEELAGFDLRAIAGKPCLLSVKHNTKGDKVYANVHAVMAMMKGAQVPKMHNETLVYSVDEPDPKVYESLPEWVRKKCDNRVTVQKGGAEHTEANPPAFDDSIPF